MVVLYKNKHNCDTFKEVNNLEDLKFNFAIKGIKNVNIVKDLPEDITGEKSFLLKYNPSTSLAAQVYCGRKYSKLIKTSTGLIGKVFKGRTVFARKSECNGAMVCSNGDCEFFKRFNAVNQVSNFFIFVLMFF